MQGHRANDDDDNETLALDPDLRMNTGNASKHYPYSFLAET
jgi:hypothetical protein